MDQTAEVVSPADFGKDAPGVVHRWISEIERAEKDAQPWVNRCKQIIKRYGGERGPSNDVKRRTFALLWANIQTLAPAVYARTPTAVVGRRWKDGDPVARTASEVLERALNFSLDAMDFADVMTGLRDEYLLLGRGQAWIRYNPHLRPAKADKPAEPEDGEITDDEDQYDEVIWEECVIDHVHWEDFFTNPARTWGEVRWVARRAFMTRDELKDRFGEKGEQCPLDWKTDDKTSSNSKDDQFQKAAVYEVWDKISRKVYWVCKAYTVDVLDSREDPLGLRGFFPCPRPLLGTCGPNTIIPTPDYVQYEPQAREIDELTKRIGLLTDALKVRGYYAGTENQKLTDLLASETNTLIPVESWAGLTERGGLEKLVSWFPVEIVANTLQQCIETRKQILEDVFQITGIADIMRGDNDPNETAKAVTIKSNWGSSRVRDKQKELSRFVRDLLCLMGEVIAQKFETKTLAEMTAVKLLESPQQKQAIQQQIAMQQQAAQQAQAMGRPPPPMPPTPPDLPRMMEDPTWEEVQGILRNNALRAMRIDIETDSTIEPNDQEEKQRRVEFIEAVGMYLEKTLAVVQLSPEMLPVVVEGLKFLVRGFRVGREMEDIIESALDKLQARAEAAANAPPGQNPQAATEQAKAQADGMKAQAAQTSAQADMLRAQNDVRRTAIDAHLEQQKIQAENMRSAADRASDHIMQGQDIKADMQQAVMKAVERRLTRDINSERPLNVSTQ